MEPDARRRLVLRSAREYRDRLHADDVSVKTRGPGMDHHALRLAQMGLLCRHGRAGAGGARKSGDEPVPETSCIFKNLNARGFHSLRGMSQPPLFCTIYCWTNVIKYPLLRGYLIFIEKCSQNSF